MKKLRVLSFHSVKGGVGKSTLSTLCAFEAAARAPDTTVVLVDMDLTGTSLADVLPLRAPDLPTREDGLLDLRKAPSGWLPAPTVASASKHPALGEVLPSSAPAAPATPASDPTRYRIEKRGQASSGGGPREVPFLNDFLLYATDDWHEDEDVHPRAMCWQLLDGPANVFVLPSSALPADLVETLPVIFDEHHSAYLEGRLEWLLDGLLEEFSDVLVVFDVPPTIPGLSRSVFSLSLRLSEDEVRPLAADGFVPPHLEDADRDCRICLVATSDFQDLRATARWLARLNESEAEHVSLVVNQVEMGWRELFDEALEPLRNLGLDSALLTSPVAIARDPAAQLFRGAEQPERASLVAPLVDLLVPEPSSG